MMTVKELIAILQEYNPDAVVTVNDTDAVSTVWNCPLSNRININTIPVEEVVDTMERDESFATLAEAVDKSEAEQAFDDMMGGIGEVLDALKINRVR